MISTLKEVREALEMLHTGLAWFKDSYPQDVNGSDDEAETEFQTALTKLDALIARVEKAEPVGEVRAKSDAYGGTFVHWKKLPVEGMALYTAPQPAPSTGPADHEIAKLVNELTRIAAIAHASQSLRQQISNAVCAVLKDAGKPEHAAPSTSPLIDKRCKIKLGAAYGDDLCGHWFFLQPSDQPSEDALTRHSGLANLQPHGIGAKP